MVAPRATLPDLDQLNSNELKALIVSQHELIVSRDSEIEQLKLLIAKLQRMKFGRSSEKLDRQIEQLQLRLEALQMNDAETVATMPEQIASAEPGNRLRDRCGARCQHTCPEKCEFICRSKRLVRTAAERCTSWEKTFPRYSSASRSVSR